MMKKEREASGGWGRRRRSRGRGGGCGADEAHGFDLGVQDVFLVAQTLDVIGGGSFEDALKAIIQLEASGGVEEAFGQLCEGGEAAVRAEMGGEDVGGEGGGEGGFGEAVHGEEVGHYGDWRAAGVETRHTGGGGRRGWRYAIRGLEGGGYGNPP